MNTHLTDESIQAYLDDGRGRDTLLTHVAGCPDCRERLEGYRQLYATLAAPPDIALPRDFARRATAAAFQSAAPPTPAWMNETVLLAGLGLMSLGVSAIFIDWNTLGTVLQRSLGGLTLPPSFNGWFHRFGGTLSLLPVAGLAAGIIALLDHHLQHRSQAPSRPKPVRL